MAFGSKGLPDDLLVDGPVEGKRAHPLEALAMNDALVVILVTEIAPDYFAPVLLHDERDRAAADVAALGADVQGTAVVRQVGGLFEQEPAGGLRILFGNEPAQAGHLVSYHLRQLPSVYD